jgi:uncharacterized membrane protein (DUF106 family)
MKVIFMKLLMVMKSVLKLTIGIVILFQFVACSNKAVYDNIKLNNRQECAKLPQSQYDECMENTQKSYEEYNRERKEMSKK